MELGTLADGLGCFPFEHEAIPRTLTATLWITGIRILTEFGKLVGPLAQSVLYNR